MKQINFRYCKLWQDAMYVVTDVSKEPAVPEVMAATTLHGVTTHQLATQIFTIPRDHNQSWLSLKTRYITGCISYMLLTL